MSQYIFMQTWRTSRGGLVAGIQTYDVEIFAEIVKSTRRGCWNLFRYCKLNEVSSLLNAMTIEEFDEIFPNHDFTPEQITSVFSKAVSEVYGLHKIAKDTKRIPAKELEVGRVYEDANGNEMIHFGKVKIEKFTPRIEPSRYRRLIEEHTDIVEGFLYIDGNLSKGVTLKQLFVHERSTGIRLKHVNTLKSRRKLVKALDANLTVPRHLQIVDGRGYKLTIEFLEVAE